MIALLLLACDGEAPQPTPEVTTPEPAPPAEPVVVYSGRSESLVGEMFLKLEQATGVDVDVRYGDTPELVTLMLTEGDQSPADIIFAQDSGHLGALANQDRLATLDGELLSQADPRFQDPKGRWVGTSGRARVLVYNTEALNAETLPASLKDLADPQWKGKLGWAPGNGSFQAHVSALRHIWGEEETKTWLAAVKANEPVAYPKNSPQVEAAAKGVIQIGWVNHYYLYRSKTEGYTAENHSFSTPGDAGNVLMLAGMAIRKGTDRTEDANKVINWMLSEEAQRHFALHNYEYPTRPGVSTHPDVPAVDSLSLAEVDQDWLADLGPTRVMLQELGLL
ncbi:MAG: iron(III) transport system substrate-binding protein [Myxococcota bacterium]|jgi:iron(III) transport system substrate-binding protein